MRGGGLDPCISSKSIQDCVPALHKLMGAQASVLALGFILFLSQVIILIVKYLCLSTPAV